MKVFVKSLDRVAVTVEVQPSNTVDELRLQIQNVTGISPDAQKLFHAGNQLQSEKTLDHYEIKAGNTINMIYRYENKVPHQSTVSNQASTSTVNERFGQDVSYTECKDLDSYCAYINQMSLFTAQPIYFHPSLTVHFGNIFNVNADCIVNATNEGLLAGGGIDYFIHQSAGPELAQFCSNLPVDSAGVRCSAGNAVITPGFKAKYRFIIHTVGPSLDKQGQTQATLLANCYRTAFKLAVDNGCKSIVFPTIATGFYCYPMLEAAQIAVKTLNSMLEQLENASSFRVYIAVFNDLEQQIWRRLLNK